MNRGVCWVLSYFQCIELRIQLIMVGELWMASSISERRQESEMIYGYLKQYRICHCPARYCVCYHKADLAMVPIHVLLLMKALEAALVAATPNLTLHSLQIQAGHVTDLRVTNNIDLSSLRLRKLSVGKHS